MKEAGVHSRVDGSVHSGVDDTRTGSKTRGGLAAAAPPGDDNAPPSRSSSRFAAPAACAPS
jgi:hypothetical protein